MPNPSARGPAAAPDGNSRRDTVLALLALLEREQQALHAPDADALAVIAREKELLCQALQPPRAHARAAASRAPSDDAETRALLQRAYQLNTSNATLLAMHRASCESRLRLLRGGSGAATVYHANGYLSL